MFKRGIVFEFHSHQKVNGTFNEMCYAPANFSLILFGVILTEKERFGEAETFLLLVTIHEPRLVEGCSSSLFVG